MKFQLIKLSLATGIQERLSNLLSYFYEYENEIKGTLQRAGIDIVSLFQKDQALFCFVKVRDDDRAWEMLKNEQGEIEVHIKQELHALVQEYEILDNLFNLESAASCPF